MTITPLNDFLITCDGHDDPECHREIVISRVADKYDAQQHAEELGWVWHIRSYCPACEEHWIRLKERKP